MKRGHPRFHELLEEMADTHVRKGANYVHDHDPLSNLRACEKFGILASTGAMIRMSDKWERLIQLTNGKKDEVGESMKDTLIDLASYCLLEIILLEENEGKRKKPL